MRAPAARENRRTRPTNIEWKTRHAAPTPNRIPSLENQIEIAAGSGNEYWQTETAETSSASIRPSAIPIFP